jgi:aminobenzoyl-glutamate transport protein
MSESTQKKKGIENLQPIFDGLERLGNLLPTPFTMFLWLWIITAICSLIFGSMGASATNPSTGDVVVARSLFTKEGIMWLLGAFLTNYTGYAPLGLVLVMTLGIGMCEEMGLIDVLIRKMMSKLPRTLVPYMTILIGLMGQIASDSAQLVIPALTAAMYLGVGRHPVCGGLTGYCGTALGYIANPIITGTDATAVGLTNGAMVAVMPEYANMDSTNNYYFKVASAIFLSTVMGVISDKVLEPRFGTYTGKAAGTVKDDGSQFQFSKEENRGLTFSGIATLIYVAIVGYGLFSGFLLAEGRKFVGSPFLKSIIPFIFMLFMTAGVSFGLGAGRIKTEADATKAMTRRMSTLGSYLTMAFMASQFISLFNWSQMGNLLSINGANFLAAIGLGGFPLILLFVLFIALLDFLVGSASAKWAICAPIFAPMLAFMGIHPGFTQVAYRVGDAAANIMSPTNAFLWMLLDTCKEKYDENTTIGTFLSNQFVYFVASQIGWWILLFIWMQFDLPVGPGISTRIPVTILG